MGNGGFISGTIGPQSLPAPVHFVIANTKRTHHALPLPPPAQGGGLPPGFPGLPGEKKDPKAPKKKYEPKPLTRVGKRKRTGGVAVASRLPKVFPTGAITTWFEQHTCIVALQRPSRGCIRAVKCKLRQMKLERIKDYLLLESEFIRNQEVLKPKAERETEQRDKVSCIFPGGRLFACLRLRGYIHTLLSG
jgi:hypothetical protein